MLQGCGFVSFALPEDAERAVKELSGSQLGNRPIQASLGAQRSFSCSLSGYSCLLLPALGLYNNKLAVWAQVQSATRRASNEVRKERKRKLTGQDGEPTPDAAPDAAGASRSEAPKAPRIKRVRTAEQKERGAGKQRLVRTAALGNLTAACSASALALARSLGQVPTLARRPLLLSALQRKGWLRLALTVQGLPTSCHKVKPTCLAALLYSLCSAGAAMPSLVTQQPAGGAGGGGQLPCARGRGRKVHAAPRRLCRPSRLPGV